MKAVFDLKNAPFCNDAIREGECSRLFLGAPHLDVPNTLDELENVLAGRYRIDKWETSTAGLDVR